MIKVKKQHPYIDEGGVKHSNLVKFYAEDGDGNKYKIKQIETGIEYDSAVDIYPSRYTYSATDNQIISTEEEV